jgi:tRNA threonylcarbamoyladenosine biosynthesis protein TsaE
MQEFILSDVNQMRAWAAEFAKQLKAPVVVALHGDLGMGKSEIARTVIQTLRGADTVVPSPTFTLVQTYDADDFIIYHYDMYRLKTPDEAYELGVEDSFYDGVNLIEWPEKIEYVLPKKSWKIYIKVEENIRYFEIIVENEEQQQRLEKIEI